MKKENIFVSGQGNEYTFKKLPDGKLWIDGYLREKVEGAVWNEKYNCYMYTWEQALKAVPKGLRLPTAREFLELCLALGYLDKSEKEVCDKLVKECGFGLAGFINSLDNVNEDSGLYVWSSSPRPAMDSSLSYGLYAAPGLVIPTDFCDRNRKLSVRCIKD